ncbi:DUF202 domain-containing protein [Cryptosporangium aurantiacum]|uniref:DUF202 domain-containing protein n=1 Tax=Cryptosporangium aurantiacum TaxID=134849 RepID=A0A1M7MYD9_9ACTN|nr:DUF202 domain-containing protein [Cryptosporangium aurantiacum]SHM96218.1 protein of unknown function [Cryptosporangium aurantiacum]
MTAQRRPPGLAAERTALSWVRSLTGLVGVTLLLSRGLLMHWPVLPAAIVASGIGVLVLAACILGERRWLALRRPRPGPPHGSVVVAITAGALLVAAVGALVLAR